MRKSPWDSLGPLEEHPKDIVHSTRPLGDISCPVLVPRIAELVSNWVVLSVTGTGHVTALLPAGRLRAAFVQGAERVLL